MAVPVSQMVRVASYVISQKIKGNKRYPLVLMLEPLFRCNLECAGCGKIQFPEETLNKRLSPEQCFKAVDECGAPMVSIPGGEPLIHPEIKEIVEKLTQVRPHSVGQASRIPGVTPAALSILMIYLRRQREAASFSC